MAISVDSFIDALVAGAKEHTGSTNTLTDAQRRASDALNHLARLGQGDHAKTVVANAANAVSYDAITGNADLSDAGKQKAAAAKFVSHMSSVAAELEADAQRFGKQHAEDSANTFGIAGLQGDHATLSISRRDAAERVGKITDSTELQRVLAQANRNGDDTMCRAIADHAMSIGDAGTLNAFTAAQPQHADAVKRLWTAAQHSTTTSDVVAGWHLAELKPSVLGKLSDQQIEAVATEAG